MVRYDVFSQAHKGLRYAINSLQFRAGSMDFDNDDTLKSFAKELNILWKLLDVHAEGEDKFILPMLKSVDEQTFKNLEKEHEKFLPIMDELKGDIDKIVEINTGDRYEMSVAFGKKLNDFIAHYYVHLQSEELLAMPILWDNYDDVDLMIALAKFPKVTPPHITSYFAKYMLPSVNHQERVSFLAGIKKNAPAPVFDLFNNLAREILSDEDWQKLHTSLN